MGELYTVPEERFFRLHQPRPRFKGQVEDVLVYMAREINRIGELPVNDFKSALDSAIRRFPGNANLTAKTVANWRTEIDALFGLIVRKGDFHGPSRLASTLSENMDLVSFFKTFLVKFQYPGGHVKPHVAAEMIKHGVSFKPAAFVVRLLLAGQALSDRGNFWVRKEELTAVAWNDLAVTRGEVDAKHVAELLITLRSHNAIFDTDGDVIRYAGDILDYMVLANILYRSAIGRYYLVPGDNPGANLLLSNDTGFQNYRHLYNSTAISTQAVASVEDSWFEYAGNQIDGLVLDTDPLSVLMDYGADGQGEGDESDSDNDDLLTYIRELIASGRTVATKLTGDTGESLVLRHEFERLDSLGLRNLATKVKKIPDHLGIGYDIKSFSGLGDEHKYIEVKTSISNGALAVRQFHLTKNEWNAAEALGARYFIYRLLISRRTVKCFVIQDPVGLYRDRRLGMRINDGADIEFSETSGNWEPLFTS